MFKFFSSTNIYLLIQKLIKFINSIFFLILVIGLTFALVLSPPDYLQGDHVSRAQNVEVKTLLPNYLLSSQGDRMSMANSVEGRYPFLDTEFIEFISKLHFKCSSHYSFLSVIHQYNFPNGPNPSPFF